MKDCGVVVSVSSTRTVPEQQPQTQQQAQQTQQAHDWTPPSPLQLKGLKGNEQEQNGETPPTDPDPLPKVFLVDELPVDDAEEPQPVGDAPVGDAPVSSLPSLDMHSMHSSRPSSDSSSPSSDRPRKLRRTGSAPKRPLSAYNLFFKALRAKLLREQTRTTSQTGLGFAELGRQVGAGWKLLTDSDRVPYEQLARQETERYRGEMHAYKAHQKLLQQERQELKEKEWMLSATTSLADSHVRPFPLPGVLFEDPAAHTARDMPHDLSHELARDLSPAYYYSPTHHHHQHRHGGDARPTPPVPGTSWQPAHLSCTPLPPPPCPWTQSRFGGLVPVIRSVLSLDDLPVPPGRILHYPDPNGMAPFVGGQQAEPYGSYTGYGGQSFVVQYQIYHMPEGQAHAYVDAWESEAQPRHPPMPDSYYTPYYPATATTTTTTTTSDSHDPTTTAELTARRAREGLLLTLSNVRS